MVRLLYYFGCIREAGHYLWTDERNSHYPDTISRQTPGLNPALLKAIDGVFAPHCLTEYQPEGLYQESIVPPVRIVAWWDRSVDKRPGSNSALIGYGFYTAEDMVEAAIQQFPSVMNRQPRPTRIKL